MTTQWTVTESVDTFHAWPEGDTDWTETFWFGAWLPEQALTVYVYHWFRPELGIYGGGCLIWDDRHWLPWDSPSFYYDVNRPVRGRVDLNALSLDCGTSLRTVDEGRIYDIEYQRGAVELAMRFTARESPIITDNEGTTAFFAGHLDQAGHYGGTLRLEGRDYAIDCHGIRDRSWGPRVIGDDIRLGYCHGQSPEFAFLAYARPAPDAPSGADEDTVFKGYLQRGDRRLTLTGGSRKLHRRDGRLVGIDVDMVTATGETVGGRGTVLNRFAYMPYPNLLTWLYLVRWEFAGGLVVYGEEQDAWSLPLWRAHVNAGGWSGQ